MYNNCMANTMYTYPYVEDYIEIIAGYRKPNGTQNHSIFQIPESLISLARYDVKIVESFAEQSTNKISYTDKQAELAKTLVLKYERQLFKHGVDITPVKNNPQYRTPLRVINRTSRVWIEDNTIKLQFPYNPTSIEQVRETTKISEGKIRFNQDLKVWEAGLTEYNVNWAHTFAQTHNFEIDNSLQTAMDAVLKCEQTGFQIKLTLDEELTITNSADSMREYIQDHIGGFGADNLLRLVDYAPLLGYTVDEAIQQTIIEQYSTRFWSLCANRDLKVDTLTNNNLVKDIADYAHTTNRFPIFVYEPDLSSRLLNEFNKYFVGQIIRLGKQSTGNVTVDPNVKVIYCTKIPKQSFERIPLLVSSAGMMYGGDRQVWIQNAEKVVYFTKDVYNKNNRKGQDVCKLD